MRLTPEKIQDLIKHKTFYLHGTMTICVLDLENGAQVLGSSNVINPDNFDPAIGEKVALEKAADKIWELEGYALKTRGH